VALCFDPFTGCARDFLFLRWSRLHFRTS